MHVKKATDNRLGILVRLKVCGSYISFADMCRIAFPRNSVDLFFGDVVVSLMLYVPVPKMIKYWIKLIRSVHS